MDPEQDGEPLTRQMFVDSAVSVDMMNGCMGVAIQPKEAHASNTLLAENIVVPC